MAAARFRFQPRVERLARALAELDLAEVLSRLGHTVRLPVLFDAGLGLVPPIGVLAFDPLPPRPPRSLAGLRGFVQRLEPAPGDAPPGPFHGGFAGALSYELGAAAERGLRLRPDPWGLPAVLGGLYTDFFVRDAARGEAWLVLGEDPGDGRPPIRERARALLGRLRAGREPEACVPRGPLVRLVPPEDYAARIERVRELIGEGEIYQANLSHRFERDVRGDPLDLYRRLSVLQPAPCAGFVRSARGALLCASPELLLEFTHDAEGTRALSQPIKGTIERGGTAEEDRARAARLIASEKDRAELAMIVDLVRHDLGRIARAGGVRVEAFPRLASLASVHHLVADVSARARQDVDAVDCLRALFPGGSVTGAPKLRSMEVITDLEAEGRGFAYGSLAWLDTRGELRANLLIRTLIWRPRPAAGAAAGQVTFRVGGGITWGSDPAAEEAETLAKGAPLARALEGG